MRLGVVADIHGDAPSLEAALRHLDRLGVDAIWCAGDVVGNAGFAEETVRLLRERHVVTVRGNWDRWAYGSGRSHEPNAPAAGGPWDALGLDLSAGSLEWLANLPPLWEASIDGLKVCMLHGRVSWFLHESKNDDMHGLFDHTPVEEVRETLDGLEADVVVCGHTHAPLNRVVDDCHLVNPGGLCRRLPGDEAVVLDQATGKWTRQEASRSGTFGVLDVATLELQVYEAAGGSKVRL